MSTTVDDIEAREEDAARRRATIRRYLRHPGFVIGALGISLLVLVALLAPWIAPHSPTRTDLMNTLAHPLATYWLGTDQFGRCVLSRLIHGAQVSLQVGFFVVLISLSAGTIPRAIAGYAGGWVEARVGRGDRHPARLPLLPARARAGRARGNTLDSIIVAVAIAYTPRVAAVMRSVVLTIRPRPFIEASRAIGSALEHRHAARHPECAAAGDRGRDRQRAATAIPGRGGLSFLGLGVSRQRRPGQT